MPKASLSRIAESQTSASTSRSLLDGVREHEPQAWQRLVSLYAPLVYYWCRKMDLAEQDMADVFQDVFQSVAKKIQDFRKQNPGDTFRGWLRTITKNKVRDHFRRESHHPHAAGGTTAQLRLLELPDAPTGDDAETSENNAAVDHSFQELFRRALAQIEQHFEAQTWQAFWRVVVEGKTTQEVARELSMQPGTVRVAKSRVLHRLRKELGELWE
jgi:RNA polymerase sigma-70 factor (ECF subfamily)